MSQLNYYDLHTLSHTHCRCHTYSGGDSLNLSLYMCCVYTYNTHAQLDSSVSPGELFVTSVNLAEWVICKISSQVLLV
jgi:hypothetical protein